MGLGLVTAGLGVVCRAYLIIFGSRVVWGRCLGWA